MGTDYSKPFIVGIEKELADGKCCAKMEESCKDCSNSYKGLLDNLSESCNNCRVTHDYKLSNHKGIK